MQRRTVGVLIVGWLLGLLTAFVCPAVATERETVVVTSSGGVGPNSPAGVAARARDGWIVTRADTLRDVPVVLLERPRYLAVVEQMRSWWWELTASSGAGPPRPPTPAPPKPTEAPKPAQPAASPRTP